jgi:hypothetical protein
MKCYFLYIFSFVLIFSSCSPRHSVENQSADKPEIKNEIYRVPLNEIEGQKIWIVDGYAVRREIYPEFLFGGNDERYPFIPKNEIWIDNAISVLEYEYTLKHELHERYLMAVKGFSYAEAHDSSLALELHMRNYDLGISSAHEKSLRFVSPTDCDNIKEIFSLPDSVKLKNIYRIYLGKRNGKDVWVVDGANVRHNIFPDFGLSGNGLAYKFIPVNEIWIDSEISCEETEFSIISELTERAFMLKGFKYDDAYLEALKEVKRQRDFAYTTSMKHSPIMIPKIPERDKGTGSLKYKETH